MIKIGKSIYKIIDWIENNPKIIFSIVLPITIICCAILFISHYFDVNTTSISKTYIFTLHVLRRIMNIGFVVYVISSSNELSKIIKKRDS